MSKILIISSGLFFVFSLLTNDVVIAQNDGLFSRAAEDKDETAKISEAVFYASKALQRSDNNKKITKMKDILSRRYEQSIKSAEDQIAAYRLEAAKYQGDSSVLYYQKIYDLYKELLRNSIAVKDIPEQSLSIQKKGDIELKLQQREFLQAKVDAKKQLVKARELASDFYYQNGLKTYQSENLTKKLEAINVFERSLFYNQSNTLSLQSIEIVKGQIAIIYLKEAEVLLKKPSSENIFKAIEQLNTGFEYAPKEDQKDIILKRLAFAEELLKVQKNEEKYQESEKLALKDNFEENDKGIKGFEQLAALTPPYKDSRQKLIQQQQKLGLKYFNEAKKLIASSDTLQRKKGLDYIEKAKKNYPAHPEISKLYSESKREIQRIFLASSVISVGNSISKKELIGTWLILDGSVTLDPKATPEQQKFFEDNIVNGSNSLVKSINKAKGKTTVTYNLDGTYVTNNLDDKDKIVITKGIYEVIGNNLKYDGKLIGTVQMIDLALYFSSKVDEFPITIKYVYKRQPDVNSFDPKSPTTINDIDTLQAKGENSLKSNKYDDAIVIYKQLISRRPQPLSSDYLMLGKAYLFSEKLAEADTTFGKLISMQASPSGFLWKAKTKEKLDPNQSKGLAKPYYEKFIKMASDFPDRHKSGLVDGYKYMASYSKNFEKNIPLAVQYYELVLELSPDDQVAKDNLAILKESKK